MARSFWKLESKSDFTVALCALSESGYWNRAALSEWTDSMLESTEVPQVWVVDISQSTSETINNIDGVFQRLFVDNYVVLPEHFYEVCAGLALLKYDQGLVSEEETRDLGSGLITRI